MIHFIQDVSVIVFVFSFLVAFFGGIYAFIDYLRLYDSIKSNNIDVINSIKSTKLLGSGIDTFRNFNEFIKSGDYNSLSPEDITRWCDGYKMRLKVLNVFRLAVVVSLVLIVISDMIQ